MSRFKSGIILKNRIILSPEGNESHSDLLESICIKDIRINALKKFVKAELTPPDGNKAADINTWKYNVDQDIIPDWYEKDIKRYEQEFRNEVAEYLKGRLTVICGYAWNPIKNDENGTYYLMDGYLNESKFGENNNYAESYIRRKLNIGELAAHLKSEFGDRLMPITTDLLSLDGLDDYGIVEGDVLSIPTIDLYRECRKNIPKINTSWWLATPCSTPSGCDCFHTMCVALGGDVSYSKYSSENDIRPFFKIKY